MNCKIENSITDIVVKLLYNVYDIKTLQTVENAVLNGEITIDEICDKFRERLNECI